MALTPLQERFIKSGLEGFSDQEILELVLSLYLLRRGCKRRAKELIEHFGTLRRFLNASTRELEQVGITANCIFCVRLLHELPTEILKQKLIEQPVHKSSKEVFDYLYYSMRDLKKEVFKILYLNSRNQIINTLDLFEGTLESIPIRPRDIVESVVKHEATRLIFVHNHPSGDPTPSKSDKQFTRDLVFIGMILQIKVLDHIIIGGNTYFSFADEGLIEKYEDSFLNMKIKGVFDIGVDYLKNVPTVF
jgi:DNA repair protein RadC